MDNIFGIILLILFIVFRSSRDRARGMKKEPAQKKPIRSGMERQTVQQKKVFETNTARRDEAIRKQPATVFQKAAEQGGKAKTKDKVAAKTWAEGESKYAWVEKEAREEETPSVVLSLKNDSLKTISADDLEITGQELRKAVIWSEILQRPAHRRSRRHYPIAKNPCRF